MPYNGEKSTLLQTDRKDNRSRPAAICYIDRSFKMNPTPPHWTRSNLALALVLTSSLLAAGCKKAPVQNADGSTTNPNGSVTVPANSTPAQAQGTQPAAAQQQIAIRNPDGSITNPDGSVTYPPGSNVANREDNPNGSAPPPPSSGPAPITQAYATAPAPEALTVPAGVSISVRTNGRLSAHDDEVGTPWSGSLSHALIYHHTTIFPAGTPVSGEVVASKGKGRFKGAGDLGIEVTAIGRDHVHTSEYEAIGKGRGKRSAGFTAGGGGIGALIGGLAGGGKGALIGGLAGAGGGAAAGSYTGSTDVVIPAESLLSFTLRDSITH